MRTVVSRVTGFYGAHPLHLLALLGCFALAGYAALQTAADPQWPLMLVWFLAAVIGHDLVLFPIYALADRSLTTVLHAIRPARRTTPPVPAVNYLRMPALAAGLLFLLFFPGIIEQGQDTYLAATGQTQQPYLARWLLLTAALFAISAIAYAVRLSRERDRKTRSRKRPNAEVSPNEPPGNASHQRRSGGASARPEPTRSEEAP
ncbi:hypothetical protein [Amycolatopsis jejuensis]|uniref:hypothetical protein n=1 Tax=Amycolatopsis jejuensis TaxID=330084 RepID=UPI0007C43729|nr:hypothetical protein [Amycolatopsis jejuensis]